MQVGEVKRSGGSSVEAAKVPGLEENMDCQILLLLIF
jgi:hypothetical protein